MASQTPTSSPLRKKQRKELDRFIPNRDEDMNVRFRFPSEPMTPTKNHKCLNAEQFEATESRRRYQNMLRKEILEDTGDQGRLFSFGPRPDPLTPSRTPRTPHSDRVNLDTGSDTYNLSPVKLLPQTERYLRGLKPIPKPRRLDSVPYKILDAVGLPDDFYLNMLDWGSQNILAVGMGARVYLWNTLLEEAILLCELPAITGRPDAVNSVSWDQRGTTLAIGTRRGLIYLYDVQSQRRMRIFADHIFRVGALSWDEHILSSGSRDHTLVHHDVRQRREVTFVSAHIGEICGVRWSPGTGHLATGSNDNYVKIWDKRRLDTSIFTWAEHKAAVKAIAWSPHKRGLLATGGGTADRCIKFWDINLPEHEVKKQLRNNATRPGPPVFLDQEPQSSPIRRRRINESSADDTNDVVHGSSRTALDRQDSPARIAHDVYDARPAERMVEKPDWMTDPHLLSSHDTGSQVCNLMWSPHSDEIVSSHGYRDNQVEVWNYPSMQNVITWTGHTRRAVHMAMSPDGETVCTGAGDGDETVRLWRLPREEKKEERRRRKKPRIPHLSAFEDATSIR
ncbi:WD40 repeat-like protein [Westerdykella ornata]|uniref:WD40 repeat-like protein n=1 Tax=Westerdykella ornata TaxID=318751 RepID=A0A6A6JDH8_WESOR|nr:WD40 repeat-like protein [Westerdykella ornata]KAF2274611.1 WD40 repeat-like protein [Westerdykella ornata]